LRLRNALQEIIVEQYSSTIQHITINGEDTVDAAKTDQTIVAVQLHVAERVTGQMRGFVEAKNAQCTIEFDANNRGVWIRGKNTNTMVPFGNVRAVYVVEQGQEKPLVRTK
jgi:hypothetical protein